MLHSPFFHNRSFNSRGVTDSRESVLKHEEHDSTMRNLELPSMPSVPSIPGVPIKTFYCQKN